MANLKYDWDLVYLFFLRSGATLKQTSELLGIPYQSVRRVAGKDKWCNYQWILKQYWDEKREVPVLPFSPDELEDFFREWNATNPN